MTFPLTPNAIQYTWRQLAQRAGVAGAGAAGNGFERLDLPVAYAHPEHAHLPGPGVIVAPGRPAAWQELLDRPLHTMTWLPAERGMPGGQSLPVGELLPVPLWGEGFEDGIWPFAEQRADGSLVFYADILSTVFFLLSRWEETARPVRDTHGRYPAESSAAYRLGFLDRPVVDEMALVLRAWLRQIRPGWKPEGRHFSVLLTHDIDSFRPFVSLGRGLLVLGADILLRRNLPLARQRLQQLGLQLGPVERTPFFQAVHRLAELDSASSLPSAFYFMTARPSRHEPGYDPSTEPVLGLIKELEQRGFEIGLHPGYKTYRNPARLQAEKQRLDRILGRSTDGGRQHFLRFAVPDTWRHWQQAGFRYDSSVAFPTHPGFRCGTCHPFHPFDLEQDRPLSILERPLIVMDTMLQVHRRLSPEQAELLTLELAERCRQVEGEFVLLWHNTSLVGEWGRVYTDLVQRLAQIPS